MRWECWDKCNLSFREAFARGPTLPALALGADAVSIGQGVLMALGCNRPDYQTSDGPQDARADYAALGTLPDIVTIVTPAAARSESPRKIRNWNSGWPEEGARRLRNYFNVLTMELTTLARACGKSNVHHLEPEDLVALTIEAAAMARVPLAGTSWIPGRASRDERF